MGAGAEIAGHISSKAQGVNKSSQYVMIEDLGPSFARFDSINATTDGSGPHWYPGLKNPLFLGFSIILFFMLVITLFRCGLRRCAQKSGLTNLCWQVTYIQDLDTLPPPQSSAPDFCETLNMESEMLRIDRKLHNPHKVPESNHYSTPNQHLKEVLKHLHESAVNRARAAYQSDSAHQRQEEESG